MLHIFIKRDHCICDESGIVHCIFLLFANPVTPNIDMDHSGFLYRNSCVYRNESALRLRAVDF